jgi:CheY-like chemotaxis protein
MKRHMPRILLVEDDPVSRAYLTAVLEGLPARVDAVASAAAALRAIAGDARHALWLVDARLPDADGAQLLAQLRPLAPWTPAVAHTASHDRRGIDALLASGFDRVLCKPITAVALRVAVLDALHAAPQPARAVAEGHVADDWDDHAALAALRDDRGNAAAFRRMFCLELPAQHAAVLAAMAAGNQAAAVEVLHRLRASCAFAGARTLESAVRVLQREPGSSAALHAFSQAVAAVLRGA